MTDEEVIATFMEPKPKPRGRGGLVKCTAWWKLRKVMTGTGTCGCFMSYEVVPVFVVSLPHEFLGLLHEVEARLSEEQWEEYRKGICRHFGRSKQAEIACLHTDALTKVKALAAVLRREVE